MKNLNDDQKKIVKIAIIIGVSLLAILVIFLIFMAIIGKKLSYTQIESVMLRSAKEYVSNHPDEYKSGIYETYEIDVDTLVSSGHMKELSKYTANDVSCKGSVLLFKNLDDTSYSVKLDCGDKYKYKNLKDVITNPKNIVTSDGGLYDMNGYYLYRGENVDNYATFAGESWKILRVDSDGNIRLMKIGSSAKTSWDNRYNANITRPGNYGINDFESTQASRLKDQLINIYNTSKTYTSSAKSLIIPKQLCIGKVSKKNTDFSGNVECSVLSNDYMAVGSIYASEFSQVSLDPNCHSILDESCRNYNYLTSIRDEYWTISANSESSTYAVAILGGGSPSFERASRDLDIREVIVVNGNVNYVSGDGTYDKPYVISPTV